VSLHQEYVESVLYAQKLQKKAEGLPDNSYNSKPSFI